MVKVDGILLPGTRDKELESPDGRGLAIAWPASKEKTTGSTGVADPAADPGKTLLQVIVLLIMTATALYDGTVELREDLIRFWDIETSEAFTRSLLALCQPGKELIGDGL